MAREFPGDIDNFRRLIARIEEYEDTRLDQAYTRTRPILRDALRDPVLVEMLLCPLMYYGSAEEHDMDFTQFATMFKSVFLEGFARPRGGVRTIVKAIVKKFRACGGKLMMRNGVDRIAVEQNRVEALTLESGETLTADVVFSCAGFLETMRLCSDADTHCHSFRAMVKTWEIAARYRFTVPGPRSLASLSRHSTIRAGVTSANV